MVLQTIKFLPWLPLLGAVLCLLCCTHKSLRRAAGPISVLSIFAAFTLAVLTYAHVGDQPHTISALSWIKVGTFEANFSYLVDPLTMIMLMVVCGIGSLVVLYATGYMAGEQGYARFFASVSLFIFAMTSLVMADNLLLLYLGWEGVGLCSYLLIGYYYQRPSAVAAAKKAFIVNRIGDLGFALGIFLTFKVYGTISIAEVCEAAQLKSTGTSPWSAADSWIPFLLMAGAFGKSAQIPLHVWLPDAMEGPTPVSALIHAATMVTAGVYMIARLLPLFELSPLALPTVAAIGGLTALFAATIALCQYDIKRVFAYSTVSQLGYMFLGVGVLSTAGGIFHLFTHAFFKALLFLTAGSVMHAMAGQLDLRKMSGLRHRMPITCWLMFIGCLALAGFPLLSGFFSKDLILAETIRHGMGANGNSMYVILGILGLLTAFLTAFYAFRLWFRIFLGPEYFEMGDEHHGDDGHTHQSPHEVPFWPMNAPLVVLALGSIIAGFTFEHWINHSIEHSTAAPSINTGHGSESLHTTMQILSTLIAISGIALAYYFHAHKRDAADRIAMRFGPVIQFLYHKYYIDEFYDRILVKPLRLAGYLFFIIDELLINGLVYLVAWLPRLTGHALRPSQHGRLQGYAIGMVAGIALIAVLLFHAITRH